MTDEVERFCQHCFGRLSWPDVYEHTEYTDCILELRRLISEIDDRVYLFHPVEGDDKGGE